MKQIISISIILVISMCKIFAQDSPFLNVKTWSGTIKVSLDKHESHDYGGMIDKKVHNYWDFESSLKFKFDGIGDENTLWFQYDIPITGKYQKEILTGPYMTKILLQPVNMGEYKSYGGFRISSYNDQVFWSSRIVICLEGKKTNTNPYGDTEISSTRNEIYLDFGQEINEFLELGVLDLYKYHDYTLNPDAKEIKYSGYIPSNFDGIFGRAYEPYVELVLFPSSIDEVIVKIKTSKTDNTHCLCNDSIISFFAEVNDKDCKFERFDIKYHSDKKPMIEKTTYGEKPSITFKGTGKSAGKITVKAIYKKDNKTFESEPYDMSFCMNKEPKPSDGGQIYLGKDEHNHRFVFTRGSYSQSKLDIVYENDEIWHNGKHIEKNENVDWIFLPKSSTFEEKQHENKTKFTVEASKMPTSNSDFGRKYIQSIFTEGDCDCASENSNLLVFYYPEEKGNPGQKDPNWSYYWKQTQAGRGHSYSVVETFPKVLVEGGLPMFHCAPGRGERHIDNNVLAFYDYTGDIIYLPIDLHSRTCPNRPNGIADKGIDCYASVVRHEKRHQEQLTSWWGVGLANYKCLDDLDGDLVPNWIEESAGCSKTSSQSCPGRPTYLDPNMTDLEMDAYQYGWKWNIADADDEDWSFGGKMFDKY
jgi:hypothetical protein